MARAETINPEMLTWARETAGLSLADAASRIGFTASSKVTAAEKLEEIERGATFPTRNQLTKFASIYRRPLLAFYMKAPPGRAFDGEDFRAFPFDVPAQETAKLHALLRDIRGRQEVIKELLKDQEDVVSLDFVGSVMMPRGVDVMVNSIAEKLQFSRDAETRRTGTPDDLFKELRARAERVGIFVLLIGDLGSYHHTISEQVFRGFAIADTIAPFVVINDQDARAARSFTLIHELAHIWLGRTGISGALDEVEVGSDHGRIEQFCNDVAGKFLLPDHAIPARPAFDPTDQRAAAQAITHIAESWQVSEPMVAYRLSRLGLISTRVFREVSAMYAARWKAMRIKEKEKAKETEGGPNYYAVRQFKLGNALLGVVHNAFRNNMITHIKAARVLGVNATSLEPLFKRYEGSRGAFQPPGTSRR